MPIEPPAKFFVNSGLVSSPNDIYHLLRPLLKQTVAYRYLRSGTVISHGTGWVERLVMDQPQVSTFFTPALDLHQRRLVRAPRVRDALRPAARLHAGPG